MPGIGCSTMAWIHENTAVFTPIPTPSDRITTEASPGVRQIIRHACRRSPITPGPRTRAIRCAL
jgi:hypothetical protein